MNSYFSFTQKAPNFGFNPPQGHHQTAPTTIPNGQSQETHFFNVGCNGNNGFKAADQSKQQKIVEKEPKKGPLKSENEKGSFWTVCPYCYHMYEYEKKYEDCCLLCQNCKKGFHGLAVAAPPERFLMKGEVGEHYFGYGCFPLGYSGDHGFLGDKKQAGEGDKHFPVEISDDSDDEKKGKNNGEGMKNKRVKSVPRNPKKMMGRGIKLTIKRVDVVDIDEDLLNEEAEIDCGTDKNAGSTKDDIDFFEGIDEIFDAWKNKYSDPN